MFSAALRSCDPARLHRVFRTDGTLTTRRTLSDKHYIPPFKPVIPSARGENPATSSDTGVIIWMVVFLGSTAYLFWSDKSRSASTELNLPMHPTHFNPVKLASTEVTGPNTRMLTLNVPPRLLPPKSMLTPIWSIYIKDSDIQVERPYTPVEGASENGNIRLWIKQYEHGEVGRWLHSKKAGDIIEIRGPIPTWTWKDEVWDEVIMVSGGTGITPFYQLLNENFSRPASSASSTRFTLLHSSPSPSELPPSSMLDNLTAAAAAKPDLFRLRLFVDSLDPSGTSRSPPLDFRVARIGKSAIQEALGMPTKYSIWKKLLGSGVSESQENLKERKVLFLVCGPEPMISAIAGPYGRNMSQGEVGGVLKELGYSSDRVWKF